MSSTKTKTKSTGLVLRSEDGGLALLQKIEALKSERKRILETPFKCSTLKLRGQLVKECSSAEELTKMLGECIASESMYSTAQQRHGYPVKAWNIDGCTLADIEHDILLRLSIVSQVEQDQLITEAEKLASKYITPAEEKERDLATLERLLSKVQSLNK